MIVKTRAKQIESRVPDLSENTVRDYRLAVEHHFPGARWIHGQNFGRIVAGDRLLSLRFSLIDPQAEEMAWWDASQRLGVRISDASEAHEDQDREPRAIRMETHPDRPVHDQRAW